MTTAEGVVQSIGNSTKSVLWLLPVGGRTAASTGCERLESWGTNVRPKRREHCSA